MSDADMLRLLRDNDARLRQTETKETPPLYLPWAQRVLNPFPLASSGTGWGDVPLPWSVTIRAVSATVLVLTTNNGANFWTLQWIGQPSGVVVASVTTAALAANTGARLVASAITQLAATDAWIELRPTATLNPGAIFIWPALALLRTGN